MSNIITMSIHGIIDDYHLYCTKGQLTSEQDQQIASEVMEALSHECSQNDVFTDFERLTTMKQRLGFSILDIHLIKESTGGLYRLSDVWLNYHLFNSFSLFFWAEIFEIGSLDISTKEEVEYGFNEAITRFDSSNDLFVANFGIPFIQSLSVVPPKLTATLHAYATGKSAYKKLGDIDNQRKKKAAAKREQAKLEKLINPATCRRQPKKTAPKSL